jgi:hypothetical protein
VNTEKQPPPSRAKRYLTEIRMRYVDGDAISVELNGGFFALPGFRLRR